MPSVTQYDLCDCSPPTLDKHVFSPVRIKRRKVNTNWDNVVAVRMFPVPKVPNFFFTDLHYIIDEA